MVFLHSASWVMLVQRPRVRHSYKHNSDVIILRTGGKLVRILRPPLQPAHVGSEPMAVVSECQSRLALTTNKTMPVFATLSAQLITPVRAQFVGRIALLILVMLVFSATNRPHMTEIPIGPSPIVSPIMVTIVRSTVCFGTLIAMQATIISDVAFAHLNARLAGPILVSLAASPIMIGGLVPLSLATQTNSTMQVCVILLVSMMRRESVPCVGGVAPQVLFRVAPSASPLTKVAPNMKISPATSSTRSYQESRLPPQDVQIPVVVASSTSPRSQAVISQSVRAGTVMQRCSVRGSNITRNAGAIESEEGRFEPFSPKLCNSLQ